MLKSISLALAVLISASSAAIAQKRSTPPSKAELAEITERGRRLAEYDVAAWYATDAVMALNPVEGSVTRYVARKIGDGWTVVFGRFNEKRDRFLVVYEAAQGATPKEFTVKKYETPKEDAGFYLNAARAVDTALADFTGEERTYNVAVLPAASGQWYLYVVPAQTENGVYPLGGDARYLVSQDGSKIVEKRQLHKSIIEYRSPPDSQPAGGFHTAVLDNIPEDTDVFHVLSRKPSVPEWVGTEQYVYRIEADGTIVYVMTAEEFKKQKDK